MIDPQKLDRLRTKYSGSGGDDFHDPEFQRVAALQFSGGKRVQPFAGVSTLLDAPYRPDAAEVYNRLYAEGKAPVKEQDRWMVVHMLRPDTVISNMPIAVQGPDGVTQIPLREVADIRLVSGASYIYREQQERYLPIKFSVRERDLGSAIKEAQQKIAQEVQLPVGSRLEWVGEFQNMKDAIGRLQIVVPLSLALIGFLLWLNFSSLSDTLMAMSVIPMAIVGGVFSLLLMQMPFSISAAIGFIALFGISVMNAILIISQFNRLIDRGVERTRAVLEASELQMRPVLMTCVIAGAGLVPAALSTGIGSQVQKPLAVVVVGGMMLAPFIILGALPAMLSLFSRHVSAAEDVEAVLEPAE